MNATHRAITTTLSVRLPIKIVLLGALMGFAAASAEGQGQAQPAIQVLVPTTTTISCAESESVYGQTVQFVAQVSSLSDSAAQGTVTFYDRDGAPVSQPAPAIGSATLAGGSATLSINSLPAGGHLIYAVYGGSSSFGSSSSGLLGFTVNYATTLPTVTASPNPSY